MGHGTTRGEGNDEAGEWDEPQGCAAPAA